MADRLNLTEVFTWFSSNSSYATPKFYDMPAVDAAFICCATFCIFTMQSGFALLEAGIGSQKNQVNVIMKSVADVTIGGTSFWLFGYALLYGRGLYTNWFCGLGDFLADMPVTDVLMGQLMIAYFYQMSFATLGSSIASGAISERVNFKAYCLVAFLNSITYSIAAGWIWSQHGFLKNLGAVETTGSGPICILGGITGLVGTIFIGPRLGRFDKTTEILPMGNAKDACVGLFILWWGWIAWCVASVYGFSGRRWEYAIRAGVSATLGTFGGGFLSIVFSYIKYSGKPAPVDIINGIISSLVALSCGGAFYQAWECIFIGALSALITNLAVPLWGKLRVDDPTSASSVYLIGGIVGMLSVGFFAENPDTLDNTAGRSGLFKGGDWYLLGIQAIAVICFVIWSLVASITIYSATNMITPIRMTPENEMLGADFVVHDVIYDDINPLITLENSKIINDSFESVHNGERPKETEFNGTRERNVNRENNFDRIH